jgi:hypothetical protein
MRPFRSPGPRVALRSGDPTGVAIRAISQVELVLGREGGKDLGEVLGDRLPQHVEVDVELVDEAVGRKRMERVMGQAGFRTPIRAASGGRGRPRRIWRRRRRRTR